MVLAVGASHCRGQPGWLCVHKRSLNCKVRAYRLPDNIMFTSQYVL